MTEKRFLRQYAHDAVYAKVNLSGGEVMLASFLTKLLLYTIRTGHTVLGTNIYNLEISGAWIKDLQIP